MKSSLARVSAVVLSTVVAGALTAACGSGGEHSNTLTVRSAITPSGSLTGPFLYAVDHGFYKKAGITVKVSDGKGSLSVAKDVAQGNVDIGQVGSPTVAQSVSSGLPLISVAQEYGRGTYGLIVSDDSGIKSFSDLAGKSVVVSAGSPETIFLPAVLDKVGVDPDRVKILNVDAAVKGSTFAGGQGSALGTTVPFFMPLVSKQRPSSALTFDSAGITFPDYSLVVRKDFLKSDPDLLKKFLRASFEGFAAAAHDPEGVGESLHKHRAAVTNVSGQVEQFRNYQAFTCSEAQDGHAVGWHSPDAWKQGLDLLRKYGALDKVQPLNSYFTNRFFEGPDAIQVGTCQGGEVQ